MNRLLGIALLSMLALLITATPATAMLPNGESGMMCDWFLNIHRDGNGGIINWFYSFENCEAVGGGGDGGGGGELPGNPTTIGQGAFEGCTSECGNPCETTQCSATCPAGQTVSCGACCNIFHSRSNTNCRRSIACKDIARAEKDACASSCNGAN